MEINLRKANAIQAEIRKAIAGVKMDAMLSVTEYTQDVSTELVNAGLAYQQGVNRKEQLITALYNIRKSVASANGTAGINAVLTDVEALDQIMAVHSQVASQTVAKPLHEITARIEKMKLTPTNESRIYGDRYNSVDTTVVSLGTIDVAKSKVKELKRQKQTLQDKLLSLNVNTLITITGADETVLKEEGIL